jgi:DNA-binding Lrp family transcriptional regulator
MNKILTHEEQELVRILQENLPLVPRPFAEIAAAIGMQKEEVLAKVKEWLEDGTIRRLGAMVRHQRLGYKANAMAVWDVPEEQAEEVGRVLAAADEVSHCSQRPKANGWDYNIFAMIHAVTQEECHEVAASLSRKVGIDCYKLLFSSKEFKKISMKYFS